MALGACIIEFELTRTRDLWESWEIERNRKSRVFDFDLHGRDPTNEELGPLGTVSDSVAFLRLFVQFLIVLHLVINDPVHQRATHIPWLCSTTRPFPRRTLDGRCRERDKVLSLLA